MNQFILKSFVIILALSLSAEAVMFVLSCMELLSYPNEPGPLTEWYWIARFVAYVTSFSVWVFLLSQIEEKKKK
jgi:hypothetical protein